MNRKEQIQALMGRINHPNQFSYENGIRVVEVKDSYAMGELTVGQNSCNPIGNVHGGALYTLADVVAGSCACSRGGRCVTAGSSMEFLRPASGTHIVCVATPKRLGRTLAVIGVELTNERDVVVATGTFTFYMFEQPQRE